MVSGIFVNESGRMLVSLFFWIGKRVTILLPIFFYHKLAQSLLTMGLGLVVTPPAPFQRFGKSFLMIKASNVIPSIEPNKLTDVSTFSTDIAPNIATFLPRLFGLSPLALEPFNDLAYNLTIARLTRNSSINIKFLHSTD
jgi:hypothetical protein